MAGRIYASLIILALLSLSVLSSGCIGGFFRDVTCDGNEIVATGDWNGGPTEGVFQVIIFRLEGITQNEVASKTLLVDLSQGENRIVMPVDLEPGSYKFFVYLFVDGERKAGIIREFTIQ